MRAGAGTITASGAGVGVRGGWPGRSAAFHRVVMSHPPLPPGRPIATDAALDLDVGLAERRRIPEGARGPYLAAVRTAWQHALAAGDPSHPALALALATYARDGRARGVPVAILLRALDMVVRAHHGGDPALDFGNARAWAGTQVIRDYYRAD